MQLFGDYLQWRPKLGREIDWIPDTSKQKVGGIFIFSLSKRRIMTILEIAVFFFYLFWLIFSMLAQGKSRLNQVIRSVDAFKLIPNYRFFCPSPVREDYHLYFRSQTMDLLWTGWEEITIGARSPWIAFLWNPTKRERKVFHRTVKTLSLYQTAGRRKKRTEGHLYNLLVDIVRGHLPGKQRLALQFKVTSRQDLVPGASEAILYTSPVHAAS